MARRDCFGWLCEIAVRRDGETRQLGGEIVKRREFWASRWWGSSLPGLDHVVPCSQSAQAATTESKNARCPEYLGAQQHNSQSFWAEKGKKRQIQGSATLLILNWFIPRQFIASQERWASIAEKVFRLKDKKTAKTKTMTLKLRQHFKKYQRLIFGNDGVNGELTTMCVG